MKWIGMGLLGALLVSGQAQAPRRGPALPEPLVVNATEGFLPIFDGKTLNGWDGNPEYWRVEEGVIVGETVKDKPMKSNTFLIWRGGKPADFEIKLDFKMNSTNSGFQYRSVELPDVGQWVLKGYQADFDFNNQYTGQLYEERGRGFLAMRGQVSTTVTGGRPRVIANLKTNEDLRGAVNVNGWNTLHVIARGNVLMHILNGQLVATFIDDDTANRALSGVIGMQLHTGPPMRIEFRNIYLKTL